MIRLMLEKLLHKKWMVFSLLVGNLLLISIAACHPMYKNATLLNMLREGFTEYIVENNQNPATIVYNAKLRSTGGSDEYGVLLEQAEKIEETLQMPLKAYVREYGLSEVSIEHVVVRDDGEKARALLDSLSDLENHVNIVSGRVFSDEIGEDGVIEAMVSESAMVNLNLLLDEELILPHITDVNGRVLRVKIVGIYENADSDAYWVHSPDEYRRHIMIPQTVFEKICMEENAAKNQINITLYQVLDYEAIKPEAVQQIIADTNAMIKKVDTNYSSIEKPAYIEVLEDYLADAKKVSVTLLILEIPVMLLLCVFISMIAGQMLSMEENEISLLKSRGASKGQIFLLYLMQSVLLTAICFLLALPFGKLLCQVLGSANAFLEFVRRRALQVQYTTETFLYAAGASVLSVLITIIPVVRMSRLTIVNMKRQRNRVKKPFWQKFYLDVVLLLVSIYGYYSFNRQRDMMVKEVIAGQMVDPLLLLSASLFIMAGGLVVLRIQPLLVKLFFKIRQNKWKPAIYVSFLQIIRTGSKQYFIMLFLVLTVALGIYNTTVARTILENAEKNERYLSGADIVLQELWPSNKNQERADADIEIIYIEPESGKYEQLKDVETMAKVMVRDDIEFRKSDGDKQKITLMAIHTKDFGQTAYMPDGLLPYEYFQYLNTLSQNADAILVSSNFRDKLGYELGDMITYMDKRENSITGIIYGFVDYFPTYRMEKPVMQPDGTVEDEESYLIVAHLSTLQKKWNTYPYEIWMKLKDNSNSDFVYDFVESNQIRVEKFVDTNANLTAIRKNALFQGTNGILTMSFIVILLLCATGYLIYWVLSIRSRELLFGVLRAMGMSRREIFLMLINEQIFSALLSIGIGAGMGVLASKLFVPMIQIAYSGENQALPLTLITQGFDMVRLFTVITLMVLICLLILARLVFRMKISQALKLGED